MSSIQRKLSNHKSVRWRYSIFTYIYHFLTELYVHIRTRISKTWLTSFPLISMPFISNISSPSDKRPLRSAAPPRTIRLITTLSISLRTVAPYRTQTQRQVDMTVIYSVNYSILALGKKKPMLKDNRDSNKLNKIIYRYIYYSSLILMIN